eukprot:scaffold68760_cov15-Tisochrysis_lutea.AAC.1
MQKDMMGMNKSTMDILDMMGATLKSDHARNCGSCTPNPSSADCEGDVCIASLSAEQLAMAKRLAQQGRQAYCRRSPPC